MMQSVVENNVENPIHEGADAQVIQEAAIDPSALTIGDVFKRKDLLNLAMISIQLISIFDEQDLSTKFWQAAAGLLVAKIAYWRAHGTLMTSSDVVADEKYLPLHKKDHATLFLEGFSAARDYVDVYTAAYCWLAALNLFLTAYVSNEEFFFLSSRSTANIVLNLMKIHIDTVVLIQVISNILYMNVAAFLLVFSPLFFNKRSPEHAEITAYQCCVSWRFYWDERVLPLLQGGLLFGMYFAIHEPIMTGERPGVFTTEQNDEISTKFNEIVEQTAWAVALFITNCFTYPIEATQANLKPTNIPSGHTMLVFMATFLFIMLAFLYLAPEYTKKNQSSVLFLAIFTGGVFEGFCRSFGLSHSFSGVLEALCYGYLTLAIGYIEKQSILNANQWLGEFLFEAKNFMAEALQHPDLSLTKAVGITAGIVAEPLAMPARVVYQQGINLRTYFQGEEKNDNNGLKTSFDL